MIKKERKLPLVIRKLEALLRRLPKSHPKRLEIQEQLRKYYSGYRGEVSMDYFYRYLPKGDVYYLHDLRILHEGYYFQIDTLLITPQFCLILEIKNYSGYLYFDDQFSQLIRTKNEKKEAYPDPILQAERQAYHLQGILEQHKLQRIPIEFYVVMTNSNVLIECSPTYKEAPKKVIRSTSLLQIFIELKEKHTKEILTKKERNKMCKILNRLHLPYEPDLWRLFNLDKDDCVIGVFCATCEDSLLIRQQRTWKCFNCNLTDNKAHKKALTDFALLHSTEITNREFKIFLGLKSSSQAYHLLHSLNLKSTGATKSRKYNLDSLLQF